MVRHGSGDRFDGRAQALRRLGLLLPIVTLVIALLATPTSAQVGCCYCDNCPVQIGPYCTDLMNSSASCVDLCIVQRGCGVLEFSPQETCADGCGSKPPFFSPTPTSTPTETVTPSPTISPTPSITHTHTPTETPVFCCQGNGGNDRCGISNPSNQAMCLANETPVMNAACLAGQCRTFTPTATATPTTPTRTFTPSPSQTPTRTETPTITPTPTVGGMGAPLSCYRLTTSQSSAAKGLKDMVTDAFGTREKEIKKPRYICAPADATIDDVTGIPTNASFFACYKSKDVPKVPSVKLNVRNVLDPVSLPVELIKGDMFCVPSHAELPPTATAKPAGTATPTPKATNTP